MSMVSRLLGLHAFHQSQIDTLKGKLNKLEEERNALKESENRLMDRVSQLTTELQESQVSCNGLATS